MNSNLFSYNHNNISNSSLLFILTCFSIFIFFPVSGQKESLKSSFGGASFYHDMFHGRETSNGEIYDKDDFTAAHKTLPFNTVLLVTNKKNNKSVVVRVNDRGPFVKSRVIDLSRAAAKKIGMVPFGVVPVKIKILNFLNPGLMKDSLMNDGEVWDCYGKKTEIEKEAIFLWSTQHLKHAFYMASLLMLDYKLKSVVVRADGNIKNRIYDLYVSGIDSEMELQKLIFTFRKDGFFHAEISNDALRSGALRVGQ